MIGRLRSQGAEHGAAVALLACGVLAIANLPHDELPLGWLLAWIGPAVLFGRLQRQPRRPWLRATAAALVQVGAFGLALQFAGSLSRPAILACTILPPLAFVTVRRRAADAALGLFLSFCVLLVGVILGGPDLLLLAGYGIAACLSLRFETHLTARAASLGNRRSAPPPATLPILAAGLVVAIPCLFAALAVDRTLAWIPSPLRSDDTVESASPASSMGPRRAGLDDSFDLGGGGILNDLAGEELVLVRTDDGSPVPTDLYLRSGFFDKPDPQRWHVERLRLRRSNPRRFDHDLRRQQPGAPVRWLEIERFAGARNFVFVPPHAIALRAVPGLQFDPDRMWLRQSLNAEQTDYAVAYQDLPGPRPSDFPEPSGEELGLLTLPAGLNRDRYLTLLDEWDATGSVLRIAQQIAAGLAQRCRYDRIDPLGPYEHVLDNFLFTDGDRRGYCMHFASAAALMLRLRGVPCRVGVGLYGGGQDRRDAQARIYGSQHAHAWVEIPFAGRGYFVFDPTPPDERGRRMPTQTAPGDPDMVEDGAGAETTNLWRDLFDFAMQPWLLLLILALAIAAMMWPTGLRPEPDVLLPRSVKTARRLLVKIMRALATAGHLRQRGETLEQFSTTLRRRERLTPAIADAFRSYQEVRFGGYDFDASRETRLQRGIEEALACEPAVIETD